MWAPKRGTITTRAWAIDASVVEVGVEELNLAYFHVACGLGEMPFGRRCPIQENHFCKPMVALVGQIQPPALPRFLCDAELIAYAFALYVCSYVIDNLIHTSFKAPWHHLARVVEKVSVEPRLVEAVRQTAVDLIKVFLVY